MSNLEKQNANMGDLMLDLEGLGNKSGCVITSIAAVEFNMQTGETGRRFYVKIDINSCLKRGLHVDGDTIAWWMEQSDEARLEMIKGDKVNLEHALHLFRVFLQDLGAIRIWGNGARFDMGVLAAAYQVVDKELPWVFRLERDVRTLVAFNPEIKKNMKFAGVQHHPVDDCLHQIRYCYEINKTIKVINEE